MDVLRLRLGDPEWTAKLAPYWASLPPLGTLHSKEAWSADHLDVLQDPGLARPRHTAKQLVSVPVTTHTPGQQERVEELRGTLASVHASCQYGKASCIPPLRWLKSRVQTMNTALAGYTHQLCKCTQHDLHCIAEVRPGTGMQAEFLMHNTDHTEEVVYPELSERMRGFPNVEGVTLEEFRHWAALVRPHQPPHKAALLHMRWSDAALPLGVCVHSATVHRRCKHLTP